MREFFLAALSHLGPFVAVLLLIAWSGCIVHRNRRRGCAWAFLEEVRRWATNGK
jgi:hypothetical protein